MGENVIEGKSRADNYEQTLKEIKEANANRVLCLIGRTHGPGFANIDYLEQPGKLTENLRDNLTAPLNLALICQNQGIHLTYLGTGCIYEYDENHPMGDSNKGFSEDDAPNFFGS